MIRQMIKVIWKRKRSNGFLVIEMLLTFFVLYVVFAVGLHTWKRYSKPNGFSVTNVLNISGELTGSHLTPLERAPVISRVAEMLRGMKEVRSVGATSWNLYYGVRTENTQKINGRNIQINFTYLSDACLDILDMNIEQGRWFGPDDDGSQYKPAVINKNLQHEAF